MYAVIDVETTGLRTSWHDRLIEVAVIRLDEHGCVQDQWCSLVNPNRDLGPQHIHGISATEARRAPAFADLAGDLGRRLTGRVLVAHNLRFDAMFLTAEYERIGITAPVDANAGLCTMQLAAHFIPTASRSLHDCRRAAGLPAHKAHSALHDAQAAADLLAYYLTAAGSPPPWATTVAQAATIQWPDLPLSTVVPVQRTSAEQRQEHFLARLIDRLPRQREPRADAYLDLLDQALLDRHISATEADALVDTAETLGLARADVVYLHEQYLNQLTCVALADDLLTAAERHDLDTVALLLGLPANSVDQALTAAGTPTTQVGNVLARQLWQLQPGDLVVFTGTMTPPRDQWQTQAVAAGLQVGDNVTKKTKLLIAADPDSMSGKAKAARRYGIPVVHPAAYQQMLGALVP
ncbi:exonuclease domain-containing protein [Couchioplanes azureus]|uniref:exonuclease domain-containing protein n=1 Tax=Couchioplanes caeruleus TaxID=56438 RepID=UPI0019AD375C|nr:exonuclease domain-containing protein [Couchioplanes caeruleus]GGQ83950.1 hypothetical protein GCM10010166_62730 [Couchioplanes caeruleus subsp. azureus]